MGEIYNLAVFYRVIFGLVLESTPCRTIQSQDTSRSTRALRLPQKTAGLLPRGSVNCLRLMHLSLSGHTENETPHQHPFAFRLSCSGHRTCKRKCFVIAYSRLLNLKLSAFHCCKLYTDEIINRTRYDAGLQHLDGIWTGQAALCPHIVSI